MLTIRRAAAALDGRVLLVETEVFNVGLFILELLNVSLDDDADI